jgi:hypothetical protein
LHHSYPPPLDFSNREARRSYSSISYSTASSGLQSDYGRKERQRSTVLYVPEPEENIYELPPALLLNPTGSGGEELLSADLPGRLVKRTSAGNRDLSPSRQSPQLHVGIEEQGEELSGEGRTSFPMMPMTPFSPQVVTTGFNFPQPEEGSEAMHAEATLLPPPEIVEQILAGNMPMPDQFNGDRAVWKQQVFDPAIRWLLLAVSNAHLSKRITLSARRLLAFGAFTRNLEVAALRNADNTLVTSFEEFMDGLQDRRTSLGIQMRQIFITRNFGVELGAVQLQPLLPIHHLFRRLERENIRQDVDGVLGDLGGYFGAGRVDWDDPVAYSERKLMHVLVMTCAAVNSLFQAALKRACGHHAVWTKGGPLKKVARMLNKMLADDKDQRKPRCMMQIDVIRSMVAVSTPAELKQVLRSLSTSFGGGFAYVKNLFELSDDKAAKRKHLRSVMVTLLYNADGMTFGDLIRRPETEAAWTDHENTPSGEPSERWQVLSGFARRYLSSSEIATKPVKVLCEVQILIEDYVKIREATNEVYKAARCENPDKLNSQFVQALEEMQGPEVKVLFNLGQAARAGQASTVEAMLRQSANARCSFSNGNVHSRMDDIGSHDLLA